MLTFIITFALSSWTPMKLSYWQDVPICPNVFSKNRHSLNIFTLIKIKKLILLVNYKPYSDFTNYSYDVLIENSDHSAFSSGLKFFWIWNRSIFLSFMTEYSDVYRHLNGVFSVIFSQMATNLFTLQPTTICLFPTSLLLEVSSAVTVANYCRQPRINPNSGKNINISLLTFTQFTLHKCMNTSHSYMAPWQVTCLFPF